MKESLKNLTWLVVIIAMITFMVMAVPSSGFAKDELMELNVTDVVTTIDKNGAEYTRLICKFERSVDGVKYDRELPVMAFGSQNEAAKAIQPGQTIKAIVTGSEYQGRESYRILSFVE